MFANIQHGFLLLVMAMQICPAPAATAEKGTWHAPAEGLRAGTAHDLTGTWLYKPGFEIGQNEKPEASESNDGYLSVAVPQFLNETRAWLDDSDDFKQWEKDRLARLGFDTNRAEDGWYRLWLDVPDTEKNHLWIEFEGVAMKSRAYVNGKFLGEHAGMFSRFRYDLTPHLKPGKNLFAMYVSMERIPVSTLEMGTAVSVNLTASKVKTMSKGMFGPLVPAQNNRDYDLHGIWQPVKLVVRNSAILEDVWFKPSLDHADIVIEARSVATDQDAVLTAYLTDRDTRKPLAETVQLDCRLTKDTQITTLSATGLQPKLWTPATPHLYEMEVRLSGKDGKLLDRWVQNVGFRTFEARGTQFYLNGKPYWLRGANHLPYGKNPWTPELPRKLITFMHDNNQRFTRTHCIPWNEMWLRAADEIGLGVSVEGFRPWAFAGKIGATPPDLFQHWLMENEDLIRRLRNHPSVMLYTIGNEMLLRDHENVEKWQQLSDVTKQTRRIDPTRPIVSSSSYVRDSKLFARMIEPNNIDDGDVDDVHSYKGWYAESPFVEEGLTEKERGARKWQRPFIGQEMATGYPNLDNGLPTLRYTRDVITPQAWVGEYSYPGADPSVFLREHAMVTKRWAEKLRYEREQRDTAGFFMFANECWFRHTYDPESVEPYPVVAAVRDAWAPVGLALCTEKRRFYEGTEEPTSITVTNDDEAFRNFTRLSLRAEFLDASGKVILGEQDLGVIETLPYFGSATVETILRVPKFQGVDRPGVRDRAQLKLTVSEGGRELSHTSDWIEIFPPPRMSEKLPIHVQVVDAGAEISAFAKATATEGKDDAPVVIAGANAADQLSTGGALRKRAEDGATVIILSPDAARTRLFADRVSTSASLIGEFADWTPARDSKLAVGLEPMDLKWWSRKGDWRVYVARQSHRLLPGSTARELIRFVPSHGYIRTEQRLGMFQTVLFEIPAGKGRIWVCDLDLEASVNVDPAAYLFSVNLLRAAADPESTKGLRSLPIRFE